MAELYILVAISVAFNVVALTHRVADEEGAGEDPCTPQVSSFVRVGNFELPGEDTRIIAGSTEAACRDACIPDQDCQSFEFTPAEGRCVISNSVGIPEPVPGTVYHERICLNADIAGQCYGDFFRAPQMLLVGFAETVVDAPNFEECLAQCLNAQELFGFHCRSGMFFFEENSDNCILNTEDRGSQPALYVEEENDVVDYFENFCDTRVINQKLLTRKAEETTFTTSTTSETRRTTKMKTSGSFRRLTGSQEATTRENPKVPSIKKDGRLRLTEKAALDTTATIKTIWKSQWGVAVIVIVCVVVLLCLSQTIQSAFLYSLGKHAIKSNFQESRCPKV